jgi:hypothetical protein
MGLHILPERVASPPLPRQACLPRRLARNLPHPWSKLPAETQKQVARAVAALIRSAGGPIGPSCSTNGLALLMFAQRLIGAGWKPA